MALAHAARAIEEFLHAGVADEGARAVTAAAASELQEGELEWRSPTRRAGGAAAALAPLLVAQLEDVVRALGGEAEKQQQQRDDGSSSGGATNSWAFAYHQSRGARAEGVAALIRLLRRQLRPSTPPSSTPSVLVAAMKALVALLERDRTYQYLAVRAFEEEEEGGGDVGESLQGFLLHAYAARWHREEKNEAGEGGDGDNSVDQDQYPSSFLSSASSSTTTAADGPRQQALFLRLWALLAASQPLDLPAHDLPLLARVLLGPIYRATAAQPPLSPPRRRRNRQRHRPRGSVWGSPVGEGEEEGEADRDRHPLLVPSLELLAQAARASPAFRLCLRATNHRERNMCVCGCFDVQQHRDLILTVALFHPHNHHQQQRLRLPPLPRRLRAAGGPCYAPAAGAGDDGGAGRRRGGRRRIRGARL